jgi:L-iditol 2-dehydrogenase
MSQSANRPASQSANRSAVLVRPGFIEVEARPTPSPGPDEVLVEVRAVGVCGSDVHYFTHGRIGDHVVESPLVLGHEAAGVVVAAGEAAARHEAGQRVAIEPGVPCRRCRACRTGAYNLCPDVRFFATPPIDGAFARYVVIPEDFAHPLPAGLSDEAGALLEPLSVAVWANWKAGVRSGDRVLVTGAGPIGLLVAQVAKASGAAEVTVTDISPQRLEAAARLGATQTLDTRAATIEPALAADVLIECSGASAAARDGIRALRPGGTAVLVGMGPDTDTTLPTQVIQNQEITLTGTFRYANTYPTAIALAASGAVDLDSLVTGHYGLDQVADALTAGQRDPAVIKPIVLPSS